MTLSDSTPTYSMISISPASFSPVKTENTDSATRQPTVVWPGAAAQGPKCRPDPTLVRRHVDQVEDEQAMRPALNAGQPDAEPAKGRVRIQHLGRVGPPFGRVLGDVDHAISLRRRLINIVDKPVRRITGRPEVKVVEEGGSAEVAIQGVGRLRDGHRAQEKEQRAPQKVHRAGCACSDRSKRYDGVDGRRN